MKRRILSSLMALVLVFGLLPATAFATEGESTTPADPFEGATTIYVSNDGTGDGKTTDAPTTLPEAVAYINGYTPEDGEAAPAFIISLTENLDFECDDGSLTLTKYATRILGNGHSIKADRAISAKGEGTRVNLGKPNGKDELTINVNVSSAPTLAVEENAEMYMYSGVTIHHTPEKNSGGAIQLGQKEPPSGGNFYMYGGEVSDCVTAYGAILADYASHIYIYGGKICNNKSEHGGGAISLERESTLVVDGDVQFENNTAESYGGAISLWRSTMTVNGATFTGNSAPMGGAILAIGSKADKVTAQLTNCKFTGNSTTDDGSGGALYLQDVETTLTDCTVENNTAGGGVFVSSYYFDQPLSKITLNGTNLIQNNTIADGTPCNLYLNIAGNDRDAYHPQLTVNVGNMSSDSCIGVSMDTVESAEENKKPDASVPFTVDYKTNCDDTHPSSYFFSDNPGYRVDWSENGNEARLLKGKAEYKVELDPTSLDFGSKVVDYATAPEAKSVTITNKGNMPVTVTLPEIEGYKFVWEDSWDNGSKMLPAGGSAVFTVQPKTGLPAGSHDKTARLTVDKGAAPELSVSFSVTTPSSSGNDDDKYFFAIEKVDAQDGHALNGAKFGLYLDGKQVATATSNRSGIALFRVSESDYRKINAKSELYYQELTAPEGYVVSSGKIGMEKDDLTTNQTTAEKKAETVRNYRGVTPDLLNDSDHFAYVIGYKDGNVRPYGLISRAETTTIFFRLLKDSVRDGNLLTSNTYTDVADDYWANTAISTMTGLGIVQGRSADTFDPKAPITRAQFAAICARFDTGKSSGTQTFTDVKGHWAEKYIERAAELGWIKGFEDGTFRPDTYITRAQAMTMINRVLNRIPEENSNLLAGMNTWPDCNPGDWFYLAVQEATNSHAFKHKAGNYETWTELTKNPDWTRYEN